MKNCKTILDTNKMGPIAIIATDCSPAPTNAATKAIINVGQNALVSKFDRYSFVISFSLLLLFLMISPPISITTITVPESRQGDKNGR